MKLPSMIPSAAARSSWKQTLLGALAWILAVSVLAISAAVRVSRVPFSPVRPAPDLALCVAVVAAVGVFLVITFVMVVAEILHDRYRPADRGRDDLPAAAAALAAALAFLAAGYPVFRVLPIPLSGDGGWFFIPLVGKPALSHITSLFLLLMVEVGLAVWWIVERRGWSWYLARATAGILWCAFLAAVIAGTNPLRGDPLEWAARMGNPMIPPGWLAGAPLVMQPWWPALRIGVVAALLTTLLGAIEEGRTAWRLRRTTD